MKKWIFSKKNNKKDKKQQLLKALKFSYINRKKKLKIEKLSLYDRYISNRKSWQRLNNRWLQPVVFTNWLLKSTYLN